MLDFFTTYEPRVFGFLANHELKTLAEMSSLEIAALAVGVTLIWGIAFSAMFGRLPSPGSAR